MESDEIDFIDLTPSNPKKTMVSRDEQQQQEVHQQQHWQQESEMHQQEQEQPGQQRKEQQQKQKPPQQQQRRKQQKQQQPHQHRKKRQQQQQQEIQQTKTPATGTKDKPPQNKRKSRLKTGKNVEIEAGKAQAVAFFQGTSVKYFSKSALTIAKCTSIESTFRANYGFEEPSVTQYNFAMSTFSRQSAFAKSTLSRFTSLV